MTEVVECRGPALRLQAGDRFMHYPTGDEYTLIESVVVDLRLRVHIWLEGGERIVKDGCQIVRFKRRL